MEEGYCRCKPHDIGQPEGEGECTDVRAVLCMLAVIRVRVRVDSLYKDLNVQQPVCVSILTLVIEVYRLVFPSVHFCNIKGSF